MQPSRFALIICSPSEGDAYRLGTVLDTENLLQLSQDTKRRRMAGRRITHIDRSNSAKMSLQFLMTFWWIIYFIYFSGHGGTSDGQRLLQFKDGLAIDWWFIAGASPRQLMIVDACRSELGAIGAIPSASEEWSSFTGESQARLVDGSLYSAKPPWKIDHSFGEQRSGGFRNHTPRWCIYLFIVTKCDLYENGT